MKLKSPDFESILVILGFVGLFLGFGGWVANIVKLFGMLSGDVTAMFIAMFIARAIGIFAAPLGVVLGFM